MNCYYSNLIEEHKTKPRNIERPLANDLDKDQVRRDLQIEARAHVRLQKMIDQLYAAGQLPEPASADFLLNTGDKTRLEQHYEIAHQINAPLSALASSQAAVGRVTTA